LCCVRAARSHEQIDLVALAWLGRDDYSAAEWTRYARRQLAPTMSGTVEYLLGTPLVGDFLEEGLAILGYSCEDFEIGRL
jgi:hypothetical protein